MSAAKEKTIPAAEAIAQHLHALAVLMAEQIGAAGVQPSINEAKIIARLNLILAKLGTVPRCCFKGWSGRATRNGHSTCRSGRS
jgi:hypothetical protein